MKAVRKRVRVIPSMTRLGSFVAEFAKPIKDTFGSYDPKLVCTITLKASNLSRVSLDIIYFDKWIASKFGYDIDEHGSLKEFIENRFGKDAVDLVNTLIEGVNVRVGKDTVYTTYKNQ